MILPREEELALLDFADAQGAQACIALLAKKPDVWYGLFGTSYVWLPKSVSEDFISQLRQQDFLFLERFCRKPEELPGVTMEVRPQRGDPAKPFYATTVWHLLKRS